MLQILSTHIILNNKNVAYSDVIPPNFQNKGLEEFVWFLKVHPLRYALVHHVVSFYPKHVCKYYYTCNYDKQSETIIGTIGNGGYEVLFTMEVIQDVLRLPNLIRYSKLPTGDQYKQVLAHLGCDPSL